MLTAYEMNNIGIVHIVDDDAQIRKTTAKLLEAKGIPTQTYASANEFMGLLNAGMRGCVILDIHMPGMTGLELQEKMSEQGICLPIIFLTGFGNVPMASQAFRQGAIDFLEKPFQISLLIERVEEALERDKTLRQQKHHNKKLQELYKHLTDREKTLLKLICAGYTAKEIGQELCISHRTVETHRGKIMKKLQADSLADMIYIGFELELDSPPT
jgi:two-component system, LuxR family, response regulator FixJ